MSRRPPRNSGGSRSRIHARNSRQAEGDDGQESSPGKPAIRAIREDFEEDEDAEKEDERGASEMDSFSLYDSTGEAPALPAVTPKVLEFVGRSNSSTASPDRVQDHSVSSSDDLYDPMYLMMQLFDLTVENRPQLLSDGPPLALALTVLDRTPEYETHKIGLLYVRDEKQTSESAILGNAGGSLRYLRFLRGLGAFTKLEGLSGYTGGLDTTNNSDGKFGLIYKDACAQVHPISDVL